MTNEKAFSLPEKLKRKFHTNDPFRIAEFMNINVQFVNFKKQKGAFKVVAGNSYIFINENLSDEMQRIVCAHELGHALMHKDILGKTGIKDFDIFNSQNQEEYDTNVFTSNLLLDEKELLEYVYQGNDVAYIAREMRSNVNLISIKMNEMQKSNRNYQFNLPDMPNRDFLGKIDDSAGSL